MPRPKSKRNIRGKKPKGKQPVTRVKKRLQKKVKKVKREPGISPTRICCTKCSKWYKACNFADHEKQCSVGKIEFPQAIVKRAAFFCKICNKRFTFKNSFKAHQLKVHSTLPDSVACDKCEGVRCPNKEILEEHIKNVHDREIFECEFCKKQFVRRSHVLRHLAQKGCDGTVTLMFPCKICGANFTRKDNLLVHLRVQHILMKHYKCKQCDYTTKNFSKLIIHFQKKHVENYEFECDVCGKTTKSRAAITKHLETHGEKKFACDVCGYTTYTIEVMRRHVLTHFADKPHKCSLCGRSYIQRLQLVRHLERHAGNVCIKCNEKLPSKAALILHMRHHNGMKTMSCPVEGCTVAHRDFPNEISLENHIKTHLIKKQFPCEVCHKTFSLERNMRVHVSTHTLERPRRCMYCVSARAYVRGEQLVKHVRKAHPQVFREHLAHVRRVLGVNVTVERVKKSELDSILNVMDAESERILEGCGEGVLYGGIQEDDAAPAQPVQPIKSEDSPIMSERELADSLSRLLQKLIDQETLAQFGWPDEGVDTVLEKIIEQCDVRAADRTRWSRVQRLRENAKQMFLHVTEDRTVARMLTTHTIDQIVRHILAQVDDAAEI